MKKLINFLICALIFILILFPKQSKADYTSIINKRCIVFPKYNLIAWGFGVNYKVTFFPIALKTTVKSDISYDHGCSYAHCVAVVDGRTIIDVRIGSGAYTIHNGGWVKNGFLDYTWYYGGGMFEPPAQIDVTTIDPDAKASSTLDFDAAITSISIDTAKVTMDNFTGWGGATIGDPYVGTSYQVFVWKGNSEGDTIMTPAKVIYSGSVLLQKDSVKTTGFFAPGDFIHSDSIVTPINNLSKTFIIPSLNDSGNSIKVSVSSGTGIGTFDPTAVFDNNIIVENINLIVEGIYDPDSNILNITDTVKAFLRNSFSPYSIVDSAKSTIDSTNFTGKFKFMNASNGTYYIQIKHRNSIETWSKAGGNNLIQGAGGFYNFSYLDSSAFGNNLKLIGTKYCIYSGDVNQDGIIDAGDLSHIENDSFNFIFGYVSSDVNGDNFVDASDLSIVDNNAAVGIYSIIP